jgi:hypothetical protein
MELKAPAFMASLSRAANSVGLSIKRAGALAYHSVDQFAAKRPLVAAVGGLAYMLLGGAVSVAIPVFAPITLPMMFGASLYAARGLKHLFNPSRPASDGYVRLDDPKNSSPGYSPLDAPEGAYPYHDKLS